MGDSLLLRKNTGAAPQLPYCNSTSTLSSVISLKALTGIRTREEQYLSPYWAGSNYTVCHPALTKSTAEGQYSGTVVRMKYLEFSSARLSTCYLNARWPTEHGAVDPYPSALNATVVLTELYCNV